MSDPNLRESFNIVEEVLGERRDAIMPGGKPPRILHHYCGLGVAGSILEDEVWLSHAEYSNDEEEIIAGRDLIRNVINRSRAHARTYADDVLNEFDAMVGVLQVYIWCLSAYGNEEASGRQDRLSQWRAYGADGRGACVSIQKASIDAFCAGRMRINPVIYDWSLAANLLQSVFDAGFNSGNSPADTAAALEFFVPLIKNPGFAEEQEWILLYIQKLPNPSPAPNYRIGRDLHVPYHRLKDVLKMDADLIEDITAKGLRPFKLSITEVMIGPSRHKELNRRSMRMRADVASPATSVSTSLIPYRS